jgi:hypothetical protein
MDVTTNKALNGETVRIEWSSTGVGPWTVLASVTTGSGPYDTGQYAAVVYPPALTFYRFTYAGHGNFDPAPPSNVLGVHVKPALDVPKVPSSAKHNKSFTVSGSLKPQFPAGQKTVTLAAYRYNGHKWVSYKSYKATNANNGSYTKYSARIKISKTGKYRFNASTSATAQYSATTTDNSKTVKIK